MCLPALAGIGAGLGSAMSAIGTAVSVAGTIFGAVQQSNQMKQQAAMHERQAELERISGSYRAEREAERVRQAVGTGVAAASGSGLRITGTTQQAVQDIGTEGAMDVAATRFGTRVAADNERILGAQARSNARSALIGGFLDAGSTVISQFKPQTNPVSMDTPSATPPTARPTTLGSNRFSPFGLY